MDWNTMFDEWPWFSGAGILLVLLVAFAAYNLLKSKPRDNRAKPHQLVQEQQDGWTPTGRIDFVDPESTGNFILQVEETKSVESSGGVEHREVRWRRATLDEVKSVVVSYHTQRNLTLTASYEVGASNIMRRNSGPQN